MNNTQTKTLASSSLDQTSAIGVAIGEALQPSTLIGLVGSLGAGKTNLTQGIGEGIGALRTSVVSPTFTICVPHQGRIKLLHLDAYRIKDGSEVDELALDEELEDGSAVIVEWAELIERYLPEIDLMIRIEVVSETQRRLEFEGRSEVGCKLIEALPLIA
jgi:tRNA threonylcarbamoyladenosine biosynthesis protein TsaE